MQIIEVAILVVVCYLTFASWHDFCRTKDVLVAVLSSAMTVLLLDFAIFVMDTPLRWWIHSQSWAAAVYAAERLVFVVVLLGGVAIALMALGLIVWKRMRRGRG
jgi:energy-converting hydrogenase Eha subunit A